MSLEIFGSGGLEIFGDIWTLGDGAIIYLGVDKDIAIHHRAATLTANTAVTGILEGTPVTPALAANSLIMSNLTNDGDILIAGSDGGNSKACLFFDASAPDTILYYVGGTWTAGATTWTIPAVTLGGTLDANNNNLTNVNTIIGKDGGATNFNLKPVGSGMYVQLQGDNADLGIRVKRGPTVDLYGTITAGTTSTLVLPVKASSGTTQGNIWFDTTDNLIHFYSASTEYVITASAV